MLHTKLPLFPLPSHILPGGRLPLRIVEDRYLRMIKESSKTMGGFGIVMVDTKNKGQFGKISPIGTHVKIIDFYSLDDGTLGIVVEGVERFLINEINVEEDGLKTAKIKYISNWPAAKLSEQDYHITEKLSDIFKQHPELSTLYTTKHMTDASWVSQRWLEILPIPVSQKQHLLQQANCLSTIQILKKLFSS